MIMKSEIRLDSDSDLTEEKAHFIERLQAEDKIRFDITFFYDGTYLEGDSVHLELRMPNKKTDSTSLAYNILTLDQVVALKKFLEGTIHMMKAKSSNP